MKRIIAIAVVIAALGSYVILTVAESFPVGKMVLSGQVLELDNLTVMAKGDAGFVSSASDANIPAGTMRLKSISADTIRMDLARDKSKKLIPKEASATGGVVMKAKRADVEKGDDGKQITVLRDVIATAQSAVTEGQDKIVLRGNVVVKVVEPGIAEPIAMLTGETVSVSLKDNKITVAGNPGKRAEITVTPKESEKQ